MTILYASSNVGAFSYVGGDAVVTNNPSTSYMDPVYCDGAAVMSQSTSESNAYPPHVEAYLGSAQTSFWTHFNFTTGTGTSSLQDGAFFGGWNSARGNFDFYVNLTDSVTAQIYYWNGSSYTAGASFDINSQWSAKAVDIYFYKHASNGEISFYYDGVLLQSLTGLNTSNFATDAFRIGTSVANAQAIWSEFIIADECTIGWHLFTPDLKAPAEPIRFVGSKFQALAGATSGTTTIALNSGLTGGIASAVATGDIVIAVFAVCSTADRTLVIDDGTTNYTLIGSELYANDNFDANLRVAYKIMGGSPDTTVRFGNTGAVADSGVIGVYVFRNVDTTTPLDVAATTSTGTNSANPNPNAITPTTYGSIVVAVAASAQETTTVDLVDPNGLYNFVNQQGSGTNLIVAAAGWTPWRSGALDLAAFTASNTNVNSSSACVTIALRPVAISQGFTTPGAVADVAVDAIRVTDTYINSGSADQINYYSVEDMPQVSSVDVAGEIKAVVVNARALKGDSGPGKLNAVARIYGTNYHSADITLGEGIEPAASTIIPTNPATSTGWTFRDFNDLVLGVRSRT